MSKTKTTRHRWDHQDWVAKARQVRALPYCRSFTDFLLIIGVSRHTAHYWRKHPEWKALIERVTFEVDVTTFDVHVCRGPTIKKYQKSFIGARAVGATEAAAHVAAAEQAILEARAFSKQKSTKKRIARNGGTDPVRPGKGRYMTRTKRNALIKQARLILKDMRLWAVVKMLCDFTGKTVPEVLRERFSDVHRPDYARAAEWEKSKLLEGIERGEAWGWMIERYWGPNNNF